MCDHGFNRLKLADWWADLNSDGEPSKSACLAVLFLLIPDLKDITLSTRYLLNSELLPHI